VAVESKDVLQLGMTLLKPNVSEAFVMLLNAHWWIPSNMGNSVQTFKPNYTTEIHKLNLHVNIEVSLDSNICIEFDI